LEVEKVDLNASLLADLVAEQLEKKIADERFEKLYKELRNRM
jgi:ribosomal protein S3